MKILISVIISYVLTCAIELIILLILKEKNKKILFGSLLINLITNVSLNLFINYYHFDTLLNYFALVIGLELLIITAEGLLYYLIDRDISKSIKYAIILNVTSYLVGLILSLLIKF